MNSNKPARAVFGDEMQINTFTLNIYKDDPNPAIKAPPVPGHVQAHGGSHAHASDSAEAARVAYEQAQARYFRALHTLAAKEYHPLPDSEAAALATLAAAPAGYLCSDDPTHSAALASLCRGRVRGIPLVCHVSDRGVWAGYVRLTDCGVAYLRNHVYAVPPLF